MFPAQLRSARQTVQSGLVLYHLSIPAQCSGSLLYGKQREAAAIEAHFNDLLFYLGQASFVGRIEEKRLMGTLLILASIALFSCIGLAALHYLIALTVGTHH